MALGETETQQRQNDKCWLLDKGFLWAEFSVKYRVLWVLATLLEKEIFM